MGRARTAPHGPRVSARLLGAAIVFGLAAVLGACGADAPEEERSDPPGTSEAATVEETEPTENSTGDRPDPEEAFRTWLEASREPDPEAACGAMTDEVVEQAIAEMEAEGWPEIASCEELIEVTAALYEAAGYSTGATVEVIEATDTDAELFVTYHDSGECGTVVMAWQGGRWMITEQSQECGD